MKKFVRSPMEIIIEKSPPLFYKVIIEKSPPSLVNPSHFWYNLKKKYK